MSKLDEFKKLRVHYWTGRDESYKNHLGKKVNKYRHGVKTDLGDIEISEWRKMAYDLIVKYNELDILEQLKVFVSENYPRSKGNDIEQEALDFHMSRIFESPDWFYYNKFRLQINKINMFDVIKSLSEGAKF